MGDRLGRQLGYPTANIEIDTKFKLIPADGIYAATAQHEHDLYKGMLYIGNRPTINGSKKNIEINLFAFNKDIYGESLSLNFYKLLRGDAKFSDLEGLKAQLEIDKTDALRVLSNQVFSS
jgi:riboflavin kinase/FMN adenylyltransferase